MDAQITYQKFAQYYDLYVERFEEDLDLYTSLCKPYDTIVEVGCGSGRVLKRFLEHGFHLTGVDISQEMLDVAKEKLKPFIQQGKLRLKLHDFQEKPLPEQYDKVLVTFYTFNYVLDQPEIFLRNLFLSMSENAMLLMDLFYPKTRTHKELDNVWQMHELRHHDRLITLQDKRTVTDDIEERLQIYVENGAEIQITTHRKYYPPAAIKRLLESVGFQQVVFAETYNETSFTEMIHEQKMTTHFLVSALKS